MFVMVALFCSGLTYAIPPAMAALETPQLQLDREKFEFEKANEAKKNRNELLKAAIAGLSLALPILVGIYTLRVQQKNASDLKAAENKNAFELKAAEIVMDAKSPFGVKQKASVLQALFPDRLPPAFIASFDPQKYTHTGPNTESKMQLLQILVENPGKEQEIVTLWRRIFPGDKLEQLFPGDYPKDEHNKT